MGASPEGAPAVESSAVWPAAPCAAGPTGWHDGAAGDRAAGGRLGDQAPGHGILRDWNSSSRVGQPPLPRRIGAGPRCFCVRDFRKTYMPDLRSMRWARLGPSAWRGRSRSSGSRLAWLALCTPSTTWEAFSTAPPQPGKPRLRCPGDQADDTVRSQQTGALNYAKACFMAMRNPAHHQKGDWDPLTAFHHVAY
jgi:hypothetical protein